MSKQVNLPKISLILQKMKISPKRDILPFYTKAFNSLSITEALKDLKVALLCIILCIIRCCLRKFSFMVIVLYFGDVVIECKSGLFQDKEKHPRGKDYRLLVTFAG